MPRVAIHIPFFLQEKNGASSHDYFTVPVTVLSSMLPVLEMSS